MVDTQRALEGADLAIYLVHSMIPSARLTQGSFQDMDLIVADHFARAAAQAGVKQMIYLGGLIPGSPKLSQHLRSRLEVENTLKSSGVPLTAIRAGLIIGSEGSSFQILLKLVQRLPFMICPEWTNTKTQAIGVQDVVRAIRWSLNNPKALGKTFDLGSPEIVSYREMMLKTAAKIGNYPKLISVPLFTPHLSRLWLSLITGAPRALVSPLIQSLKHSMLVDPARAFPSQDFPPPSFPGTLDEALDLAVADVKNHPNIMPRAFRSAKTEHPSDVRSVQRIPLPRGKTAEWVAKEYIGWLPRFIPWIIEVQTHDDLFCTFKLRFFKIRLLILRRSVERSTLDRQVLYITGGLLAKESPRGRLEFLQALGQDTVLAAIHDFKPRLPWFIYTYTQALIHAWIMNSFARHCVRVDLRTANV